MTVKELLLSAAVFVNSDVMVEYINNNFISNNQKAANDFTCLLGVLNLVLNEISGFVPLITTEEALVHKGKIYYSTLKNSVTKVLAVLDEDSKQVNFSEQVEFVTVDEGAKYIKYSYAPKNVTKTENIPYSEWQVPSSIIVYGVVAEYCIYECRYDEAVLWNKKFVEGIKQCAEKYKREIYSGKNSRIKGRVFE